MMRKAISLTLAFVLVLSCSACSSASQDPFVAEFAQKTKLSFQTSLCESENDIVEFRSQCKENNIDISCEYNESVSLKNLKSAIVYMDIATPKDDFLAYYKNALEIMGFSWPNVEKVLENGNNTPAKINSSLNEYTYLVYWHMSGDTINPKGLKGDDIFYFSISVYDD